MTSSDHLLDLIRTTPEIDLLLRSSFGFDTHRKHNGEDLRLASGAPLETIAGEFAGGAYFLCAERNGRRPVVFASSEGEGGPLADDLAEALEIVIASKTEPEYVVADGDGQEFDPPFGEYVEPRHGGRR
ncbi:hypothetical protein ACFQ77_05390 [Streptomyces virginiae]|uniref:hypothetical protein n=1 Tax=Streptomyces virginiae TaxID=1961 RepID=UPI0036C07B38